MGFRISKTGVSDTSMILSGSGSWRKLIWIFDGTFWLLNRIIKLGRILDYIGKGLGWDLLILFWLKETWANPKRFLDRIRTKFTICVCNV